MHEQHFLDLIMKIHRFQRTKIKYIRKSEIFSRNLKSPPDVAYFGMEFG